MALVSLPAGYEDRMSLSVSYSQDMRLRQIEFGDGYIQRTPYGINARRRSVTASWENLTASEHNTLYDSLDAIQQASNAVELTAGNILRTDGKFVIETIDVQMGDHEHFTISASMTEVFDL